MVDQLNLKRSTDTKGNGLADNKATYSQAQ
jgi:hypothetical protein